MKTTRWTTTLTLAVLLLLSARCEKDTATEEGGKPDTTEGTGKEDAWNYENDPTRFNVDVIYKIAELPTGGSAAQMPWSETWWPMRKDGFNQRWQGSTILSPMEKYDQAFNNWTPPEGFMNLRPFSYPGGAFDAAYYDQLGQAAKYESQNGGNAQARNGRDDDGDGETDESDWDGLGSWWGKCHMWSATSILVPEPKRSVEYNGVRFEYSDLTALAMEAYYNRANSYMLGGRCNAEEVTRDAHGRATQDECRDTNAGSFHVIVTNMLGRHQRAFVMDAASDFEVWNHPISDYRVDSQAEVTLQRALELLGRTDVTTYPYNPDAKAFYEVSLTLGFATDGVSPSTQPHGNVRTSKSYHYLLELDGSGSILGGEWLQEEGYPDFFWLPVMSNYSRGGNPNVKFSNVQMLIEMATRTQEPPPVTEGEIVVESTTPLDIPDNDPAGVTSTIDVSDAAAIASLKVRVDITHTYIGDLTVELRHGGKSILLHNQEGGSTDNLKEEYTVPDFVGASASGAWDLFVADKAGSDVGKLNSWAIVYAPGDGSSTGSATSTITHSSSAAVDIPDNNAEGVTSVINVPESGTVKRTVVNVDITHPYIGDLVVELRHDGTSFTLHKRTGGSNDDIVKEYTLSDFNNVTATGDWTLFISDNAGKDVGKLNSWSVKLEVTQ
jgi:subtilisin-like proprotein convertase family protein